MKHLINLDLYPLDRLESEAGRTLVANCIDDLARRGMFTLTGFLRGEAINRMLPGLLARAQAEAYTHAREHNIYFDDETGDLPLDHPALARVKTVNHTLCGDQLGEDLLAVYLWPELTRFLARVMGKPALYPMADPLACANVMTYYAGEGLNWHFDRSEFTTTVLLQEPLEGGEFQYRHGLRSPGNPNLDGIANLLRGADDAVETLRLAAGDLNVFKGVDTAHRVTPTRGERPRMMAVFTYYERPGRMFSDQENLGFYGRISGLTISPFQPVP